MNEHLVKQVEHRAISELIPYARNARTHSDAQVAQLARSITEFGFTNPVLVDADGGIIAGHGRVLAAQRLGMDKVPTLRVDWLTEAQRRAYVLADNQLALQAGWDKDILSAELMALMDFGYELGVVGFPDQELEDLLRPAASPPSEADPEECPALADSAVTSLGDVWCLRDHRLICGDCTDPAVITKLMAGGRADIVWTDPPYNVAYGDKAEMLNKKTHGQRKTSRILNDDMDDAGFREFLGAFYRAIFPFIIEGGCIYVAHSETERANFTREFLSAGYKLSGLVVWKKNQMVMGRSDYQWIHEPIIYGWKPGAAHRWYGGRKNTTVMDLGAGSPFSRRPDGRWELQVGTSVFVVDGNANVEELLTSIIAEPKPQRSNLHPTMKPVALIERMLRNHVRANDCVLDPFGGSGSTLMAAERLAVRARLCELSPDYCDVIVRRWQEYTGLRAIHELTGAVFPGER